jgi:membrane peptidoglycan carboxypeptidase
MQRVRGPVKQLVLTIIIGGVAVGVFLAALLPGFAAVGGAQHYKDALGQLSHLKQRSTLYDAKNNIIGILGEQNREDVRLDQVPKLIQNAVISVEDKTFWTNDGIDLNSTARALLTNLSSGQIEQGGSTITQQLVKNRLLSRKRDIHRKVREIVLALRLNDRYSKREILDQYLNTVYFGQGSYGVKSAVQRFFLTHDPGAPLPRAKRLSEVTVGEAALLAGLISNPEGNNPFANPSGARARRKFALEQMLAEHYITPAQMRSAEEEPLPTIKPEAELRPRSSWEEEVQDRLFTDPIYKVLGTTVKERKTKVLTGGLKVYATLDPTLQGFAQDAMNDILPEKPGWTGALVSMDPRNGFVKAMVAGPGFESSQYNIATTYPGRQVGSTWKTMTLAAALENGFSPNDLVDGTSPCDFGVLGQTANAEGGGGRMTLRDATAGSVNCAFVRTELAVGFDKVIDTAFKMGITQTTLKPILTLTLGTIEATATEMATVASTIANGGMKHPPVFVSKIEGPDGRVIFDANHDVPATRAISQDTASCEIDMLRGVIEGGTGTAARLASHDSAGKTGTTDNKADANFLQITPTLVDFVWHGNATARIPGAGFGGDIPARISKDFMDRALYFTPNYPFPPAGPTCDRDGEFISPFGRTIEQPEGFPDEAPPPEEEAPATPATPQPQHRTTNNNNGGGGNNNHHSNGGGGGGGSPATSPPTSPPQEPPTSPPAT